MAAALQDPLGQELETSFNLADLRLREEASVDSLDMPEDDAQRLMSLGFLPGARIRYSRRSPFGDPRVFQVDGCEIALRAETARRILMRRDPEG